MPRKWDSYLNSKFISVYREHECLWRTDCAQYRDKHCRDNAIRNIMEAMAMPDLDEKEVKRRIKSLRSTYLTEVKKIKDSIRSGIGADGVLYKPKVAWFYQMDSFIKYVENKLKQNNQDGALAKKTTSLDFETVLSEASESRLGECDPLLIQDESLPSMPRPSSSVNVVPLPVAITPPLQPNDIPDEDESTLDAPETFEHQLQDFKKDFIEGKMINGALQKLDEVCDKFDRLTHGEDEYDHFGIYVVSLLRHCPYQQAILLQKKIINLILESQTYTLESGQMNEESPTHIFRNETSNKSENSKLHNSESTHFAVEDETSVKVQESSLLMDITPSATVMSQPLPICPTQSCELSELTRFSLSVQEDKSNGRGECRTFVDTSETHSHHLSDEFITNKNCIDDSLRKLDDMSEKFNMLDQKEHGVITFDHFGKYVASLLRGHPLGRAIVIEKKIIDFIWKAHVEPMLHVSGTI